MIKILTSVMGLGTYVPALLLEDCFLRKGMSCQVQLIESFLKEEKIVKFLKNKEEYHKNFKAAKLGHKLAERQLGGLIDDQEKKTIFEDWNESGVTLFVVMSGNWMETLLEYVDMGKIEPQSICAVHMDVGATPSWCKYMDIPGLKNISVYDENTVQCMLEYPKKFLKTRNVYEEPAKSHIYIHGGGWGMGTYQERHKEFHEILPYKVKTTIHSLKEAEENDGWDYYLLDSKWMPWKSDNNDLYPPIGKVTSNGVKALPNGLHQGMYSLYEDCCGIISKAGGGTLMDSLITGTPLVFIEPIAMHEQRNQDLWIKLKFGITYEDWKQNDFSIDMLKEIYNNIIENREKIPDLSMCISKLLNLSES